MGIRMKIRYGLLLVLGIVTTSAAQTEVDSPEPDKPKMILIIGDGMDDQQIAIAREDRVAKGAHWERHAHPRLDGARGSLLSGLPSSCR